MLNRIIVAACMAAFVNSQTMAPCWGESHTSRACVDSMGNCAKIQSGLQEPCEKDCLAKLDKDYPTNKGYYLPDCPNYQYPCTDWATAWEYKAASDNFDARRARCYQYDGDYYECDRSADPAVLACKASSAALCAIPCGIVSVGGGGGDDSGLESTTKDPSNKRLMTCWLQL